MTGFWGVRFQLPSWVQGKPRGRVIVLAAGALAIASLAVVTPAQAQTWTRATSDYNLYTHWIPSAFAPPVAPPHPAIFDTSASTSIIVTSGPIAPDSWTFTAASQYYTITGAAVNFSLAGPTGGIIDNANAGQTISIANNIGESVAGVQVQLLGNNTLILSGTNTYSGGTTISGGGTLQVTNDSSVGTGNDILNNGGVFQADGLSDLTFINNFKVNPTGGFLDSNGIRLTIAGNISDGSGPGALTVQDSSGGGAGAMVILTGTNTYTGGTTICACGTLQLGDATHTGSIVGAVLNEGQFNIVNANTAGITSITNIGGFTSFFGSNTAGTATIVNDLGETGFFNNSTAGSANITNRGGGATLFGMPGGTDTSTAGNATIDNGGGPSTPIKPPTPPPPPPNTTHK